MAIHRLVPQYGCYCRAKNGYDYTCPMHFRAGLGKWLVVFA